MMPCCVDWVMSSRLPLCVICAVPDMILPPVGKAFAGRLPRAEEIAMQKMRDSARSRGVRDFMECRVKEVAEERFIIVSL